MVYLEIFSGLAAAIIVIAFTVRFKRLVWAIEDIRDKMCNLAEWRTDASDRKYEAYVCSNCRHRILSNKISMNKLGLPDLPSVCPQCKCKMRRG